MKILPHSESESIDLLNRIHERNKSTGGLKFVSRCYGIIGFIKFSGPYYILVITERRKIGKICCHPIYAITKNEMLPVQNSTVLSDMAYSMDENRRISELRKLECPKVLEDVMYILIVFSEIGVHLVLKLSNCMYNGRLEIWPRKDWELESIHKVEVL
ncbi:hypothetical protein FXO38_11796 [Capsicum annuum]|uniref:phosphoinositide phosphatase SAC2-like n=1 Tax=Capsicum annuum TaxID=4072 RepID=UPI001FB15AF4|nr:phosphoinositide phosphatase SAC2-like [Capsicum annuum]XP_047249477.1 phosphoinositide phosphatase SAC2-like [Capsicum annuum]KAF3661249.1 hypothetical protein FXO38_11796 [Capsicum annuum]